MTRLPLPLLFALRAGEAKARRQQLLSDARYYCGDGDGERRAELVGRARMAHRAYLDYLRESKAYV